MSRRSWVVIASLAAVLVIVLVAVVRPRDPGPVTGQASATPTATVAATPTPTVEPTATPTAAPTATPTVEPTPGAATAEPTGDPRLRYAAFLLRLDDDRTEVAELNAALAAAAQAEDLDAVRTASVDILDFVDAERLWLLDHPPARCYRGAHASALDMLEAYGTAAERFIDWTSATGALDRLAALTDALDAASQAGDALADFGRALEATSCPI